jgi:type I restriction enzyme S subunit
MKSKLSDVCEIKHGFAFKGEYFCETPTDYLLVTPGNFAVGGGFQEKLKYYNGHIPENYVLMKGDLIVTMTDLSKQGDTLGFSALVPTSNRYLHNQRIGLVTIKSQHVLKEYVYWLLRTYDYQRYIVNHASGSTVKHTSPKTILNYETELPDLPTQRAIAAILSCLDEKIANNTKINHHLEQMAQAIFKSWFVDFEPWGGTMPDDWKEGTLGDICSYNSERIPVSALTINTYISTENMAANKAGFVSAASLPTIPQTTAFKYGDTLISNIRPYFKKIVYCGFEGGCSTDVLCFRPHRKNLSLYLYNALYNDRFFEYMVAGSKGTKMPRGDKQQIMTYRLVIPPNTALAEYESTVSPMNDKRLLLTEESARLAALRDTLLPRLMSGELSVADLGGAKY